MDGRTLLGIAGAIIALLIVLVLLQILIGILVGIVKLGVVLVAIALVGYGVYWGYSYLK